MGGTVSVGSALNGVSMGAIGGTAPVGLGTAAVFAPPMRSLLFVFIRNILFNLRILI
jgi:hypothetical protein